MLAWFVPLFGWTALIGTCVFAWTKGAHAERIASTLVLASTLLALLVQFSLDRPDRSIPLLILEGALSVGFLLVAIRYASAWLGAAMLLQAVQFSFYAYYFVADRVQDRTFALLNNINFFIILICIVAGTIVSWRARDARAIR